MVFQGAVGGVEACYRAFNANIDACAQSGDMGLAAEWLSKTQGAKMKPDTVLLSIRRHGKGSRLVILDAGGGADADYTSAIINACAKPKLFN